MKIFTDINTYFLNSIDSANDYSNSFYIRRIAKHMEFVDPDKVFWGPHKRDFFEIAILQKSTTNIQIGNQTLQDMKNSLAIVSPFQVINYSDEPPPRDDEGYILFLKSIRCPYINYQKMILKVYGVLQKNYTVSREVRSYIILR